jgi:type IV pilus assembly protein PilQ
MKVMKKMVGRRMLSRGCALFLLMPLIFGCANTRSMSKSDLFYQKWREKAEATKGYSPISKPRVLSQQTEQSKEHKKGIYSGEQPLISGSQHPQVPATVEKPPECTLSKDLVTIQMPDVELGTILRTMAKAVNQSIMINETVKGKTNINIIDKPWDEAFKGLLATHSLTYSCEGDILRVISKEDFKSDLDLMENKVKKLSFEKEKQGEINAIVEQTKLSEPLETRVFHVNYTDPKKLKENLTAFLLSTHTDIAEEEGAGEDPQPAAPVDNSGTVAGKNTVHDYWERQQDAMRRRTAESNARAAASAQKKEKTALVRGTILVDEHTNSIIVQAPASDMARIVPLIDALDRPTRQIRIEAHIVEATDDVARQLGIQWGGLYHNTSSGRNYWLGPGQQYFGDSTPPEIQNPWNPGYGVNFPVDPTSMVGKGFSVGYMAEALGDYLLAMQLTALQEDGLVNILSSPNITTLDNKKAVIESGKDIPFQTVEEGEVKIEWRKATLRLEVTPHIVDDNLLNLELLTHKDEVDFTNTVNGNPTIFIKHAETNVVMFDGQTTVIGGLKSDKVTRGESGVPGLKDVPGLGYLFKGANNKDNKEEVLIFITPHLLEERTEPPPPVEEQKEPNPETKPADIG